LILSFLSQMLYLFLHILKTFRWFLAAQWKNNSLSEHSSKMHVASHRRFLCQMRRYRNWNAKNVRFNFSVHCVIFSMNLNDNFRMKKEDLNISKTLACQISDIIWSSPFYFVLLKSKLNSKVHIFWEAYKICWNLQKNLTLVSNYKLDLQISSNFSGLLKIYEIYSKTPWNVFVKNLNNCSC
jgi:hypothetical protein